MHSIEAITVIAGLVDILDANCQTYHTPPISVNQPHLEALVIIRGILLQVII
jgi:hypothetical protein